MLKKFPFKLNIQHFAETEPAESNTDSSNTTSEQASAIDYDKLADIISKRSKVATDSALKGYLKQQGLSGEQLDEAVNVYKAQQTQKEDEAQQAHKNAIEENKRLKAQILNSNIDVEISKQASDLGISAEKMAFLTRLVDRSKVTSEKGEVSTEAVKTELEAILKAFPDFKGPTQTNNNGFQRIGGDGAGGNLPNETDARLDAIFGIASK